MSTSADQAVGLLCELLSCLDDPTPADVAAGVATLSPDDVRRLISGHPKLVVRALDHAPENGRFAFSTAILQAVNLVPAERFSHDDFICRIAFELHPTARKLCELLGAERVVNSAVALMSQPDSAERARFAVWRLRESNLPGRDKELSRVVSRLAECIRIRPERSSENRDRIDVQTIVSNSYVTLASLLAHFIERKTHLAELEVGVVALSEAVERIFGEPLFRHSSYGEPFFTFVRQLFAYVDELQATLSEPIKIPAQAHLARALFYCQWDGRFSCWRNHRNDKVEEATKLLARLDANVVVEEALKIFPRDGIGQERCYYDDMPHIAFHALDVAARFAAGPTEGPVLIDAKGILDRLEVFLPPNPGARAPRWALEIYATLGAAILPELCRLVFTDRRLSGSDGIGTLHGVLSTCNDEVYGIYRRDIIDALRSEEQRVRFDAESLIQRLPYSRRRSIRDALSERK